MEEKENPGSKQCVNSKCMGHGVLHALNCAGNLLDRL